MRRKVEEFFATPSDAWPSWALSNHDSIRVATRWAVDNKPDVRQTKMLLAMLSSLRGSSFVYQGEELGLTEAVIPPEKRQDPGIGSTGTGRDGCRTPMPWDGAQKNAGFTAANDGWLPVPPEHAKASVAAQEKDPASMLNFTRSFLKWRKAHPALLRGKLSFENAQDNVLAFTRTLEGESVFCAFNLSPSAVTIPLESGWTALEGHGLQSKPQGQSVELAGFGGYFGRKKV